jgi:hypothetical protein
VGHLEVADQAEQQVRPGADEIAQPDPAIVRRERYQIVDRGVDAAQWRVYSMTPSWCSSCLIAVDNAGWVMNSRSAARR